MSNHKDCLILNQDYTPLHVCSWERAICMEIIGKELIGEGVRVIEYYDDDYVVSAGGDIFPLPAVAVTNHYVKRPRIISLKKRNLMIRDEGMCQYCGSILNRKDATIDHVVPRAHFNDKNAAHTWDNTVISCFPCNSRKGDRVPKQAGMKLLKQPVEPKPGTFYVGMAHNRAVPNEWKTYLGG